jgi:hypothetical protein
MNQIVYTFYICFVLHTNLIPCRPGAHLAEFSGILLNEIRICSMSWWCMVFTMGSPLYVSNYVTLLFFGFSLSHKWS